MINPTSRLTIRRIPLESVQVREFKERDIEHIRHFVDLYRRHPGSHIELIHVVPSQTHENMYSIENGHNRYIASLIAGRDDILAVIEEKPKKEESSNE